jgi:hypothetical protein
MTNNRIISLYVYLLSTATFFDPVMGYASDFVVQPRILTGVMNYSFKSSGEIALGTGQNGNLVDYDDNLIFLGGGVAANYRRYFADIYFQQSAEGEVFVGETAQTFGFGLNPQRQDLSVSVGFSILPYLAAFAGYKYGKTENDGSIFDGGLSAGDPFPTGIPFSQKFEEQGPFIGAVFGWIFGNKGRLTANIAVSFLEADENASLTRQDGGINTRSLSGDAIGVSYGLGWHSSITDRLGYAINLKGYNYSFENFSGTSFVDNLDRDRNIKIDENMIGINFDISYSLL